MMRFARAGVAALALAIATPVAAQAMGPGGGMGLGGARMFQDMSPEGRAIMRQAMRDARESDTVVAIHAARGRMLDILAADPFDAAALQRTMQEERQLVLSQHQRMHAAMVAGFSRLTPADRRAFATSARAAREWMEDRREQRRERFEGRAGQR